jgi:hypothetical protein
VPRGFKGVRRASAAIQAKRDAGGLFGPNALYFQLPKPDDTAIVRFLEEGDEIAWCWVHEIPVEGRQYGRLVPCLDQDDEEVPCPGCERNLKRSFKGWVNVIWFNAPIYRRDKDGKLVKVDGEKLVVGNEDQVAVWTSGVRLFEDLDETDDTYRGLRSRRFRVKRKGTGLDTKYSVKPEDPDSGAQPFTDHETELAEKKYDLAEFMKIPSYDDFMKLLTGQPLGTGSGNGSSSEGAPPRPKNPFLKN